MSRAQGVACRELLETAARTDEHEIRDVRGGNQQHEQHAAPQQLKRGAHVPDDIRLERDESRAVLHVDEEWLQRTRILGNPRRLRIDLLLRLGKADAGREARDLIVILAPAAFLGAILGAERQGKPEPHFGIQEHERIGKDAHDFVAFTVDTDVASNGRVTAAEHACGIAIAQNSHTFATRLALFLLEQAPACR